MILQKKIQGGSMYYALAVCIIIGMTLFGILMSAQYNRTLLLRDALREEVIRNAVSAIHYTCAVNSEQAEMDIDLFGRGKDSVHIIRRHWGAFDLCISRSHTGKECFTKIALLGMSCEMNYALWLADMDRALKVTGNTLLRGNCFLPRAGIERTYIEGKSFTGHQLVEGDVNPSSRFIPATDPLSDEQLKNTRALPGDMDSAVTLSECMDTTIQQSFAGRCLVINEHSPVILRNVRLIGYCRIISSTRITVEADAVLENVILAAPEICISRNFEGTLQAFASDSIVIGTNVHLHYPSVLALAPANETNGTSAIVLDTGCEINGEVFAIRDVYNSTRSLSIVMKTGSTVNGTIYDCGSFELHGTVNGSVTCQQIRLQTNSAVYEHTFMDAVIDQTKLPQPWVGSMLGTNRKNTCVVRWLR